MSIVTVSIVLILGFCVIALLQLGHLSLLNGVIQRGRIQEQILRPGSPHEIQHLDLNQLLNATRELESLGFVPIADLISLLGLQNPNSAPLASPDDSRATPPPAPNTTKGFCRVFQNDEIGVQAKIMAVVDSMPMAGAAPRITTSFLTAFCSFKSVDPTDWTYSTSNRVIQPIEAAISALFHQPRGLWTRLPGADVGEVWEFHLKRREEIADLAGVRWQKNLSLEHSMAGERRIMEVIREAFARQNPLKLALYLKRFPKHNPPQEWLGELAGRANFKA